MGGVLQDNTSGGVLLLMDYKSRKLPTIQQRYPFYKKDLGAISHFV